ncbi:hypothetical protein BHE90_000262 [Fusarium euwallaceae]|uniref:Uncharacterized protein n=1 Tax=Fusarium euwallaceae TaxID=1147111 RepID=A0A430MBB2_9HYPO|nr:hypothetical protein BHE90_000262 [Fusarium euwallaceae]
MIDRPVPDEDIYNIAMSWDKGELHDTQDPYELPSVTGENATKFSTWASVWNDWTCDHIPEFRELWKACSDDPEDTGIAPIGSDVCPDLSVRVTGAIDDEDEDGNEGDKDSKPATVIASAGSPMEGSILAAVIAPGMVLIRAFITR